MADSAEEATRARLAAAKGKARYPGLGLWNFVADLKVLPDVDEISEEDVPEAEREDAELRRAALIVAATDIVDWCIDDIEMVIFDENDRVDEETTEESFIYDVFPARHRRAYGQEFFRKALVTAVQVAADLADPDGGPAACIAEEIIRHAVGELAVSLCEEAGLGEPWLHPDELLLEDADFELLYAEEMDGLENDPGAQRALGVHLPSVEGWFSPFNPHRAVHPYAETDSAIPEVHDLYPRLRPEDDPEILFDLDVVNAAAPIAGFPAGSDLVALMRQGAVPVPGQWVADDSDPEASFAALVAASSADYGSGWLEWESYAGADSVRSEPVIQLTAHRHFPVGDDEPWVHTASSGGQMLAIPLRYVVSYRPDPGVRARWERRLDDLDSQG
ncbi:MAG: hypothetical protein FWE35_00065 [Streptosporangiales bacterium]|nr:hypothetical protein [Streptosporangiales bacterium]